jgi:polyisoprenoid-binding protein YceI
MRKSALALALILTLAAAAAAPAQPPRWEVDPPHCNILFRVQHILVEVPGRFNSFTGDIRFDPADLANSRIEVAIEAGSIDTGVAKRDRHLRSADFLEVEKHPQIRFASREILHRGGQRYLARGELSLHGVTREIELPFVFYGTEQAPMRQGVTVGGFEANYLLDRLEFGVGSGKWHEMGVLGRQVRLDFYLELIRTRASQARAAGQ